LVEIVSLGNGVTLHHQQVKLRIEAWGLNSLRVRATLLKDIDGSQDWALLEPKEANVKIHIDEKTASIANGKITCMIQLDPDSISSAPWSISYHNTVTGKELTSENHHRFKRWRGIYLKPREGDSFHAEARFKAYEDERIYGLGQHQHGRLDNKGCVIELLQRNTEVCIPFMYSTRGYGFLWNNPAVGRVELGYSGTNWVADRTRQMDYWITARDTPAEILRQYAEATGFPLMMPEYATGFWQCKLRYQTQEELLEVAREHKRRRLPLSVIVADFFHWTLMGEWKFDPEKWPDVPGMVQELADMGVKLMVSVWPTVNQLSENFTEMKNRGYLVGSEHGDESHTQFMDHRPEGPLHMYYYDATNPEAGRYVWGKVKEGYYKHGIKTWWLDACEPEIYPMSPENLRYHIGNGEMVTNVYPMLNSRAFYEGMKEEGEDDIILLTRSAWAGSQRYGALVWSGDIPSTFEALQAQVKAGLNIAMSGIPWWNTDIGGFHGGDPEDPEFRELLVRWFQFGVFSPVMRLHGHRKPTVGATGGPNEAWSFGKEAYTIIKGLLELREQLRPYILDQMREAHLTGSPVMRPLFFDFPEDEQCYVSEDQYMFGFKIMVAPVLEKYKRSRCVYLPSGSKWREGETGRVHRGGVWIQVDAPLEKIPYFYRE
jgi:alpha-D-xyloside xylohydrolase